MWYCKLFKPQMQWVAQVTSEMCHQISISWNHRCGDGTRAICWAGCPKCGQGIPLELLSIPLERLSATYPR